VILREQRCTCIQGYLISRPLPAEMFAAFMSNRAVAA
jgi:EAL domain-containing protein (putative c-di-GMP-specific phosphodiesterase class I)